MSADEREELAEGSLISHLVELRDRLLRAVIAVGVIFLPCAIYSNELFTLVATPLIEKMPDGTSMIATSLVVAVHGAAEAVAVRRACSWRCPTCCIRRGLSSRPACTSMKKTSPCRWSSPASCCSTPASAFAYFVVFPLMFAFLTTTAPVGVQMMTDMANYLDFVLLLYFAFGIAFEIPVATVLLAATGMVSVETMGKNRGYVVLGIFVVAAFLTPPDAMSQSFMAVPMYLLYEIGIIGSRLLLKQRRSRQGR